MTDEVYTWWRSDWMIALGWTFVHSIWQIALIGLLLFLSLRAISGRQAGKRYVLSTLALWFVVVSALSTFIIMLPERTGIVDIGGSVYIRSVTPSASDLGRLRHWLEARMPLMLIIWLAGAGVLLVRLVLSLGWLWHVRRLASPVAALQVRLDQFVSRHGLKTKPVVGGSGWMTSPVTLGHLKPVILFPVAMINRLEPHEAEAILAHELAHIVRRDYLSNLVQSFIEAVFYYHPVVWWMSGVVRGERENRADDLAIRWCGDAVNYARTLVAVQEWQQEVAPSMAIGFAAKGKQTLTRIQRILNLPYKHHHHMEKSVLLSLSSLVILAFTLQGHTPGSKDQTDISAVKPIVRGYDGFAPDTIPAKGIYRIHKKTEDQEVRIEVEDGDIRALEVDGRKIEPTEYGAYDSMINELFGGMAAPPAPPAPFIFRFPGVPSMPSIPDIPVIPHGFLDGFEFSFEMPDIPEMPEMPEIPPVPGYRWKYDRPGGRGGVFLWEGGDGGPFKIMADSITIDGQSRIVIINDGDTTIVVNPAIPGMGNRLQWHLDDRQMESFQAEMKAWQERAQAQSRRWQRQSQRYAEQYRQEAEQEARRHAAERERLRAEIRMHPQPPRPHSPGSPQRALTEQLIRDELIDPYTEAEIVLTPDKLRINGKRMPDNLHDKYLRLYEARQGDALSGNSRLEFTTKARRRF